MFSCLNYFIIWNTQLEAQLSSSVFLLKFLGTEICQENHYCFKINWLKKHWSRFEKKPGRMMSSNWKRQEKVALEIYFIKEDLLPIRVHFYKCILKFTNNPFLIAYWCCLQCPYSPLLYLIMLELLLFQLSLLKGFLFDH